MSEQQTFNSLPEDVIFREEQRFRQPWLMVLLFGGTIAAFIPTVLTIMETSSRQNFKVDTELLISLIVPIVIMVSMTILIFCMSLVTEVRASGLYVKFFPMHLSEKNIPLEDVVDLQSVTYRPILEYGGWGIRYRLGKGKAYNVHGNRGVRMDFKNGRHLLIGSQKPDELFSAIRRIMPSPNRS